MKFHSATIIDFMNSRIPAENEFMLMLNLC